MTSATIDREVLATIRAPEQSQVESRTSRSAELSARARRSLPDGVPMAWMAGLYGHRRCSSPTARAATSPTSTAPPTSTSTRPT